MRQRTLRGGWDIECRVGWENSQKWDGWRDTPNSNIIHLQLCIRLILGKSRNFPLFLLSLLNSKACALLPRPRGPSIHPAVHLGASCASSVRLRKDVKPFSVYFILRTFRKVDRPPSLCTIYTDVRLWMWVHFSFFNPQVRMKPWPASPSPGINIFSDWDTVSLFLPTI